MEFWFIFFLMTRIYFPISNMGIWNKPNARRSASNGDNGLY